jgi:hypothetical protein
MALGLSLSTLGNLGRAASYGVEQQVRARERQQREDKLKRERDQDDANRQFGAVLLEHAVLGDPEPLQNYMNENREVLNKVSPILIGKATTVLHGLRKAKAEKEYTLSTDLDADINKYIKENFSSGRYDLLTPEEKYDLAYPIVIKRRKYDSLRENGTTLTPPPPPSGVSGGVGGVGGGGPETPTIPQTETTTVKGFAGIDVIEEEIRKIREEPEYKKRVSMAQDALQRLEVTQLLSPEEKEIQKNTIITAAKGPSQAYTEIAKGGAGVAATGGAAYGASRTRERLGTPKRLPFPTTPRQRRRRIGPRGKGVIGAGLAALGQLRLPEIDFGGIKRGLLGEEFPEKSTPSPPPPPNTSAAPDSTLSTQMPELNKKNRPQTNNNPGNLKIGGVGAQFARRDAQGNPVTDNQGHLVFATPELGFSALKADLEAKISGNSPASERVLGKNPETLDELGRVYAEDPNWSRGVAAILQKDRNALLSDIDLNSLIQAIARQEGYFA